MHALTKVNLSGSSFVRSAGVLASCGQYIRSLNLSHCILADDLNKSRRDAAARKKSLAAERQAD